MRPRGREQLFRLEERGPHLQQRLILSLGELEQLTNPLLVEPFEVLGELHIPPLRLVKLVRVREAHIETIPIRRAPTAAAGANWARGEPSQLTLGRVGAASLLVALAKRRIERLS
jgi:hypothetical protein